ncbi:tetratricopeptide repeat protein [Sphaerisporangium sp. B11E5]|uniref:tetratricopeptide repeat protein n=1 Tax=Sphaerisporangium sp. B11E5 TaxID=3153563 RepID=UPI00325F6AA7
MTRLCGNLPLAIQLVGNRLRHLPAWSVADLAQKLARSRRLTEIRAGNRALVAAFDLSYHGLDSTQQQAFRRLGLYPGADITPENAAALFGVSQVEAEKRLEELHDHHLIAEPRRGRYRFHDLIADYARLLAEDDPQTIRAETQRRLFDFYLAAARAADRLMFPYHMPLMPDLSDLPEVSGLFDDQDSAISWLNTELDNMRALIRYAATHGWRRHSATLPHALSRYLDLWGHWAEAAALHRDALVVWRELGDPAGEALAMADLARMCWRTAQYDEALRLASEALALQRARGNEHAVADLLEQHGLVHWHRAEYDVARDYAEKALDLRGRLGDRRGQGAALNLIGITLWHLRNNAAASQRLREALALYRQDGDRRGQQVVLTNIGDIELELGHAAKALRHYEDARAMGPHLGAQQATLLNNIANAYQCMDRYTEALDHYRDALALYQRTGDRRSEADALNNIGRCYTRMGRDDRALIHHQQALRIAVEISERYVQTHTLRNIGTIHHRAQRYDSALEHYRSSLERAKEISDIRQEADTLRDIGITMSSLGDVREARAHWRQSLALFEQLGLPEAAVVQEYLSGIDKATGS